MCSMFKIIIIPDFSKILTKYALTFFKVKPGYSPQCTRYFCKNVDEMKFNFHMECQNQINLQINQELYASYAYLTMAYHFEHPAISLPGFFNMFLFFSKEETEHAKKLIEFQNKRGGKAEYLKIEALESCDWTPEKAIVKAIELEKCVTKNLHTLHEKGVQHNDNHLCDFIESEYLQEQYKAIKDLYHLLTKIRYMNDGTGIYILDKDLNEEFKNKEIKTFLVYL